MPGEDTTTRPGTSKHNGVTSGTSAQEREAATLLLTGNDKQLQEDDNAPLPHAAHSSTPSPEQHNIPTLTNQDTHTQARTPAPSKGGIMS
ncbi:hypothetical protein SRHO_G00255660 [Serrasalmus rhombeus]